MCVTRTLTQCSLTEGVVFLEVTNVVFASDQDHDLLLWKVFPLLEVTNVVFVCDQDYDSVFP